jgi:hypothetical protein
MGGGFRLYIPAILVLLPALKALSLLLTCCLTFGWGLQRLTVPGNLVLRPSAQPHCRCPVLASLLTNTVHAAYKPS